MILTCPACGTQYAVKDGAVPPGGRQVRCAACKHRWHQDPANAPHGEAPASQALPPAAEGPEGTEAADEAALREADRETDEEAQAADDAPQPPPGYAAVDPVALPADAPADIPLPAADAIDRDGPDESGEQEWRPRGQDDEFSPFADEADARDRRSPLRTLLIALLALALLGLAFWFLAPAEWKAQVGLAEGRQTPLQLMMTHSDRQQLESGNELLAVSGRVINPTDQSQTVPPIRAQLHSSSGRLVYSWTIAPPARTLAPGQSATFNSAEVNVPAGGDELTISLGPPRA